MNRIAFSLLGLSLAACGPNVDEVPGEETSPCNDGQCFDGLMCLSDLCVDPDWEPTGGSGGPGGSGATSDDPPTPSGPSDELDILLIVDNSGSMGEEQLNLATHVGSLIDPLVAAGMDVRIGITTTDYSNYWCKGAGISEAEYGRFVTSSCLSRLGDFYFSGDDTFAESSCTDVCPHDSITLTSDTPWIEANASGNNIGGGVSITQALQCLIPQGVNGCGFEAPLESANKALELSTDGESDQAGFLRDTAHLAVVYVSDEVDCSDNPQHENAIFGEEGVGNQVFWSLPDIQSSPTSAACWNAGVTCSGASDALDCVATDRNTNGGPASDAADAALLPVARYRSQLESLRATKAPHGAEVFTFGILGVPEGYAGTLTYAEGPDGTAPESFQARFGMGPGCSSEVGEAVPPVRMRELVEQSAWSETSQLYSVCATDWSPALGDIATRIVGYTP